MTMKKISAAPKYPTKEEILSVEVEYPELAVTRLKEFKKMWRKTEKEDIDRKFYLLKELVKDLNTVFEGEAINIRSGTAYCYSPIEHTLFIASPLSIISTLHELGHHLKGRSELEACRFSVHLFKSVFPKAYAKLRWEGHMLKRQ